VGDDDRGYLEHNAAGLRRMAALAARLSAIDGPVALAGGWTASAVFAHLAFWDRFVLARWEQFERTGAIEGLPDDHTDLVNAAGLPLWLALPPDAAADQATAAATAVCDRIASLSPEAVAYARRTDRPRTLDRTPHWSPHLDEVEAALAGPR